MFSWKRKHAFTDRDTGEQLPRFGATFSTTSWLARNVVVEVLRRRRPAITVHYDKLPRARRRCFANSPTSSESRRATSRFSPPTTANLVATHSVGGNPVRMISGAVSIEPDEEWRHGISARDRFVTTAIAMPLLHRYGFPVRSSEAPPSAELPGSERFARAS